MFQKTYDYDYIYSLNLYVKISSAWSKIAAEGWALYVYKIEI